MIALALVGTRRCRDIWKPATARYNLIVMIYLVVSDDDFNPAQWKIYDPVCTSAHARVRVPLPSIKNPPFSSAPVLLIIGTSL